MLPAVVSSTLQDHPLTWQKKRDLMTKAAKETNPTGEGTSGSSGSATELSSLLPPPAVPLLATFLATRRDVPSGSACGPPVISTDPVDSVENSVDLWTNVRTQHRRLKRASRTHR
jgi:hypothetical protein